MAKRMGRKDDRSESSHLSLISHPDEITRLILEASGQTRVAGAGDEADRARSFRRRNARTKNHFRSCEQPSPIGVAFRVCRWWFIRPRARLSRPPEQGVTRMAPRPPINKASPAIPRG